MGKVSVRKCFFQFENALRILRTISSQTAVHRKKFDYCLEQIQIFLNSIIPTLPKSDCTKEELDLNHKILSVLSTLRGILLQYILSNWMEPTKSNPTNIISTQLKSLMQDLQKLFSHYNEKLSHIFDIDEAKWQNIHLNDLNAIYMSFNNYIQQEVRDRDTEMLIRKRMAEIDDYRSKLNITDQGELPSPIPEQYKHWKVKMSDFQIVKIIGKGFSADVFKAIDKRTNKMVAIKQFKEENLSGNHLQHFQREIAVLSLLDEMDEPYFIKLVGATDTFPICIMTEFMPNGGLNDKVFKKNPSPTFKTISAYCIARGMAVLHSLSIIHRDLKSLNVLLDKDDNIKICDFGFSRFVSESGFKTFPIGTLRWMAPEVMSGSGYYTFKVDVYAYGMLLSELVNQTRPFDNLKNDVIRKEVLENDLRPELPFDLNPELRKLITRCWDRNPEARPTFDEIVYQFESLQVLFDGTNVEEFENYIKNLNKATKSEKKSSKLTLMKTGKLTLREIIDDFSKNGLPLNGATIDDLWDAVLNIIERSKDRANLAYLISFFFNTKELNNAVQILRNFPRDSIPFKVIGKLIPFFPSFRRGKTNEDKEELEIDTSIAVICCRNNAAPLILVNATNERDITLAFEVISSEDVSLDMKDLVIEQIAAKLNSAQTSEMVKISAIRCALALKVPEIVPISSLIDANNSVLRHHVYICIMGIGLKGQKIDSGFLEKLLERSFAKNDGHPAEKEAQAAIIAACSQEENVQFVLEKIVNDDGICNNAFKSLDGNPNKDESNEIETLVKILMISARFTNLFDIIKQFFSKPMFIKIDSFGDQIDLLKKRVNIA